MNELDCNKLSNYINFMVGCKYFSGIFDLKMYGNKLII